MVVSQLALALALLGAASANAVAADGATATAVPANAAAAKPAPKDAAPATVAPAQVAPVQPLSAAAFAGVLQQHRGQVVVLNLWATWCVSCLKEIPDLMALEREFSPRGMKLLAVSMDDPLELGVVEAFRRQRFPEFSSWIRQEAEMDAFVSPLDPAWNELLPTTYLIGRDGQVLKRLQGKKTLAEFRAELNAVL